MRASPPSETSATPLVSLPRLAAKLGLRGVWIKDEGRRALGNFKSLGGLSAGRAAIERVRDADPTIDPRSLTLLCASDGNHGLAVAAAAAAAGAAAEVYLPEHVSPDRVARIRAQGGAVRLIAGTYDDAVKAAEAAAAGGRGLLIADTSPRVDDPVVRDVVAGYGQIVAELVKQLPLVPSHVVVQAGVGGLAAAMFDGMAQAFAPPPAMIIAEPASAACVSAALQAGTPVQISGDLATCAEMLSCGLASAPALEALRRHAPACVAVDEAELARAPRLLANCGGPSATPSGAAGLAGLVAMCREPHTRARHGLTGRSDVLLIVSERDIAAD